MAEARTVLDTGGALSIGTHVCEILAANQLHQTTTLMITAGS